jgi:alpha-galactosidase
MPGDKVEINDGHIAKANVIFPALLPLLCDTIEGSEHNRAVITVCGGSGVGKSETASLLGYYLNSLGVGAYVLSGDNYPHRIPKFNDAERERVYNTDGENGLRAYLGSNAEINFYEIQRIVDEFTSGAETIALKRMGRVPSALWYDEVDFSGISILIIEWTHGNSDNYTGVDIPILLNSTPEETLAHRRSRNRDGSVDSPFTTMVLNMEQDMLKNQAHKAKIILTKSGEIISYDTFKEIMGVTE